MCDRWHERCLLESWHMMNHPDCMNRDTNNLFICLFFRLQYPLLLLFCLFITIILFIYYPIIFSYLYLYKSHHCMVSLLCPS